VRLDVAATLRLNGAMFPRNGRILAATARHEDVGGADKAA